MSESCSNISGYVALAICDHVLECDGGDHCICFVYIRMEMFWKMVFFDIGKWMTGAYEHWAGG